MRRLLGLLRDGDEEIALAPQPSLARLDELAARLTATGLPVEVRVEGTPVEPAAGSRRDRLPHRPGGADERAQARRAGAALGRSSATEPDAVELEVLDDGPGAAGGDGSGPRARRHPVSASAIYGGALATRPASRGRLRPPGRPAARPSPDDPRPARRRPEPRPRRVPDDPQGGARLRGRRRGRTTATRRSSGGASCNPTSC